MRRLPFLVRYKRSNRFPTFRSLYLMLKYGTCIYFSTHPGSLPSVASPDDGKRLMYGQILYRWGIGIEDLSLS